MNAEVTRFSDRWPVRCRRAVGLLLMLLAVSLPAEEVKLTYDSRGNIVAIEDASTAATLRVQRFAPAYGRSGDSIVVVGAGFSTTPSSNGPSPLK